MDRPVSAARQRRKKERRAAILEAAAEVFFEAGYAGASIDAIIARVGGSKRTIYSEFGSKERLFAAIIAENANEVLQPLMPEELSGHDLRSTLLDFGRRLMGVLMSRRAIALYRVVVAEGARFPELGRVFYDNGPGRASARLAEVLEEYRSHGDIEVADCLRAADHFVGGFRDNVHLQVLLGLRRPPRPKEAEAALKTAVEIFLNGVRARR
jgi:AcrR family transcriptional regulator